MLILVFYILKVVIIFYQNYFNKSSKILRKSRNNRKKLFVIHIAVIDITSDETLFYDSAPVF